MKSVVELEINAPKHRVAALFADPNNNTRWMDDLEKIEPISGEPGMPGSKYRMVQSQPRKVTFIATVTSRNLPDESALQLEAPNVVVSVTDKFAALSPQAQS